MRGADSSVDRIAALDGLRGLAAVAVLTHHVLLASSPAFTNAHFAVGRPPVGALEWSLIYTPLHLLWAGSAWVIVFFVLSGLVLSRPYAGGRPFSARRYYPHRLLRLYLPVWGAIALAVVLHRANPAGPVDGASLWLNSHLAGLSRSVLGPDLLLTGAAGDGGFFSVLWSLHWEVVFSLLLPAFLLAAGLARRYPLAVAALAFALLGAAPASGWAQVMPCFALGVILAQRPAPALAPVLLAGTAALGLTAQWWLQLPLAETAWAFAHLYPVLVAAGACAAVLLALRPGPARSALERAPAQWAGARSFSLYLVHEPLVVALAFAVGGTPPVALFAVMAIPAALIAADLFHRAWERPMHRLSRRAGELAAGR